MLPQINQLQVNMLMVNARKHHHSQFAELALTFTNAHIKLNKK